MKQIQLTVAALVCASLVACGNKEPEYAQIPSAAQRPQVVYQQAPQADSGSSMMPALIGGALGYMAGRSTAPAAPTQQSVNTHTIIRERVIERPAEVRAPLARPTQAPTKPMPVAQAAGTPAPRPTQAPARPAPAPTFSKPSPSFSMPTQRPSFSAPSRSTPSSTTRR